MSAFDTLVQDAAKRFGLGENATPLMRELLGLMTSSPGGLRAFIEKFKSAGLSREASEWLGNPDNAALTASQVTEALGSDTINSIGQKIGLDSSAVSTAMGYLIPNLVGQLTPDGIALRTIPSAVTEFMRSTEPVQIRPSDELTQSATSAKQAMATGTRSGHWTAPLLALLALLGLGWYLVINRDGESEKQVAGGPSAELSSKRNASATPSPQTTEPSRLAVRTENGVTTVSGMVHDEATRNSIMEGLQSVYGDKVRENILVNPNVSPTSRVAKLHDELQQLKTPGMVADADRSRIASSVRSILEDQNLELGNPDMSDIILEANDKAMRELTSLNNAFDPSDLIGILNRSIINFPQGNAELTSTSQALLQQAAARLRKLPAGTIVEIGGHTDSTGDIAPNLQLSQSRADAVKTVLVKFGVDPASLIARGYGSARPVASNETAEGRFQNRRIEYQLAR